MQKMSGLWIALAVFCVATGAFAQEPSPEAEILATETAEDKTAKIAEAAFEKSIMEFGELAGAAYACLADDADLQRHEVRVFDAYSKLIQLFGSERAFKFSASYGYGTAEPNDEEQCTEIVDQFEDKYGAIAQKYNLVDGD